MNGRVPGATHRNHLGEEVAVDFICWKPRAGAESICVTPVDATVLPRTLSDKVVMCCVVLACVVLCGVVLVRVDGWCCIVLCCACGC